MAPSLDFTKLLLRSKSSGGVLGMVVHRDHHLIVTFALPSIVVDDDSAKLSLDRHCRTIQSTSVSPHSDDCHL
jgi:hypothetical protein